MRTFRGPISSSLAAAGPRLLLAKNGRTTSAVGGGARERRTAADRRLLRKEWTSLDYALRNRMMQDAVKETGSRSRHTMRGSRAVPIRQFASFLPGTGVADRANTGME